MRFSEISFCLPEHKILKKILRSPRLPQAAGDADSLRTFLAQNRLREQVADLWKQVCRHPFEHGTGGVREEGREVGCADRVRVSVRQEVASTRATCSARPLFVRNKKVHVPVRRSVVDSATHEEEGSEGGGGREQGLG